MKKLLLILCIFLTVNLVSFSEVENLFRAGETPVVDGVIDNAWNNTGLTGIEKIVNGNIDDENDFNAYYKALYDSEAVYLLVQVVDEVKDNDSGIDFYFEDDSIQLFFDMGNEKTGFFDGNDRQFYFVYDNDQIYTRSGVDVSGINHAWSETDNGYVFEIRIPFSVLGTVGEIIGFDVIVNDNDNNAARDCQIAWAGSGKNMESTEELGELIIIEEKKNLMIEAEDSQFTDMNFRQIQSIGFVETSLINQGELSFNYSSLDAGDYYLWVKL